MHTTIVHNPFKNTHIHLHAQDMDAAMALDPENPQIQQIRDRALKALGRPTGAGGWCFYVKAEGVLPSHCAIIDFVLLFLCSHAQPPAGA